LWEILKQFNAFGFAVLFQALLAVQDQCDGIKKASGGGTPAPDLLREQAHSVIGSISSFCAEHGFQEARDRIERVAMALGRDVDASTLLAKLERVNDSLFEAIMDHKFLRIESGRSAYLDAPHLLGEEAAKKFPSAIPEIVGAGNCLALELYGAAVFHLIRVSEHGNRALAKAIGVTLKDKGQDQPIEYAGQDKVITAMNNKLTQARALPHGPQHSAQLAFYSEGAERCLYLKELRNEASHARKTYNSDEAFGVLDCVKGFMEFLARGLGNVKP
jgi:hypothetical protein